MDPVEGGGNCCQKILQNSANLLIGRQKISFQFITTAVFTALWLQCGDILPAITRTFLTCFAQTPQGMNRGVN